MVDPIVTPADLTDAQTNDSEWLSAQATASVRAYCGWHVSPVIEQTLILDTECDYSILLPSKNVVSVTAATLDGVDILADLEWSASGVLRLSGCKRWDKTYRGLSVTITHGYPVEETPLVGLIATMVTRAYIAPAGVVTRNETTGPFTLQQTFSGSGSTGPALMEFEKSALAPYRLSWGL